MKYTYEIITRVKPHSFESEQYKKLKANIEYLSIKKDYNIINICSSSANEGKTFTALNLSNVYAQSKTNTLLIDMDLRSPKIHRAFNIANDKGLVEALSDLNNWMNYTTKIDDYFTVLPSGSKFPFPSELLSSNKVIKLLELLKNSYDKIIIDSPPVSLFADAKIISNLTDGTLFVIAANKTRIDAAKNAIKELELSDVDIIGTILTKAETKALLCGQDYY